MHHSGRNCADRLCIHIHAQTVLTAPDTVTPGKGYQVRCTTRGTSCGKLFLAEDRIVLLLYMHE